MTDRYIKLDDAIGILSEQVFYKENDKVAREGAEYLLRNVPKIEASEDCIIRSAVISYIDRLANSGTGKGKSLEYLRKFVEKSPSVVPVVPQVPSEDCISRMETIEVLGAIFENMNLSLFGLGGKDLARRMLQNLE